MSWSTACDLFVGETYFDFTGHVRSVVVDWLDACRLGELDALLDLYDERATLDCLCENVTLTGHKTIASYWAPKLANKLDLAFTLDDLVLIGNSVQVDHRSNKGNPVRIFLHFSDSGKILHTSCRLRGRCEA